MRNNFDQMDWERVGQEADFDPVRMAELCGTSLRHLERYFAKRFGMPPREWLLRLQCKIAMGLIGHGYKNQAAAEEAGFADETHLCHAFRRIYGASPQSFAPRTQVERLGMSLPDNNVALRQDKTLEIQSQMGI